VENNKNSVLGFFLLGRIALKHNIFAIAFVADGCT